MSNDAKFDHIDLAEKQKVLNECVEAEAWLWEKKQHQDTLPKHATPALLTADVRKKAEALDRVCRPVMMKPKPKPKPKPKAESPSPASSQGGGGSQSQSEADNSNKDENATEDTAGSATKEAPSSTASAEPMETDDKSKEVAPETTA